MTTAIAHPRLDLAARRALGEAARERVPASLHAEWLPAPDRADPVDLLVEQNATREADLVPVRHGRMSVSPFTFYRGAARLMAADLATTPTAGLEVQLCGDAHLSNFGGFASPERQLLFGLNDFDETLPGPFEYDLKRMAASFAIAAQNNRFSLDDVRAVSAESVKAYRSGMAEFAEMRTMDIWYAHMSEADIREALQSIKQTSSDERKARKHKAAKASTDEARTGHASSVDKAIKNAEKTMRKGRSRDSLNALSKLAEVVDGEHRIVSRPPLVIPLREVAASFEMTQQEALSAVSDQFERYRSTLTGDRRHLLERFRIVDVARKVVGVGSVGTRAFIVLLEGRDNQDPLFLQVKEASSSVLEEHLPKSALSSAGERVVSGQRLMQAASDIFLGWTTGLDASRSYYWRQLRDMKTSVLVEGMAPFGLSFYARICGWTLARAHARSGDPVALAEYLGTGSAIDDAVADFSLQYAEQNQQDYQLFLDAIASGRIEAVQGV